MRAANRHGTTAVELDWKTVGPPPPAAPPGRRLVFEDDFGGSALATAHWSPYDSAGNAGHGLRRPSAISLDGAGHLVITAQMVDGRLVSGGMSNRLGLTYGWFEFRTRTEPDPTGTMSGVVLTWPDSGRWPLDGENDIYETGADAGTRTPFHSFVHYGESNQQYRITHAADATQWHTMAMDWRPDGLWFYRDGTPAGSVTDPAAIPRTAHHLTIQLDATATRALAGPVRMYVDYVRIYR